jgi:CheY-like chemotaxis protein
MMVVDDEPDLLAITVKLLERSGYSVHSFANPQRALEHIKVERCKDCSIVISDLRMPEMTGFELVQYLKDLRPEMKVILMTAFNIKKEDVQLLLPSTPVDAFVNKPFKTIDLINAIDQCTKS